MQGTGTQTDPYIVMNADELIEATSVAEGGDTRYVKLGADINMDGRVNVNMYFYELDGDGHTIMNINVENTNGLNIHIQSDNTTIKNISFTSCSAYTSGAILCFLQDDAGAWKTNVYNCNFSLKCTSSSYNAIGMWFSCPQGTNAGRPIVQIERCVADITVTSNNYMKELVAHNEYGAARIAWSHINIDAKIATASNDKHLFDFDYYDHCYLTGKIEFNNTSASGGSIFYGYNGKFNYTYAAVHCVNPRAAVMEGYYYYGVNFYDGDIYDYNMNPHFKRLTTAQCKDIEYLNSIGFDVVPGE